MKHTMLNIPITGNDLFEDGSHPSDYEQYFDADSSREQADAVADNASTASERRSQPTVRNSTT